jgi:hypothetical protein
MAFLYRPTEEDSSRDILPSDIFDRDEIHTSFDEESLDVRGLDVINQVLLEGIHEVLETDTPLHILWRRDRRHDAQSF